MFSSPRKSWQSAAILAAILLIGYFASIYIPNLYSIEWQDLASTLLTVLVAALSAISATALWAKYDRADAPRRIWLFLALALWLWTLAELIWFIDRIRLEDSSMGWPDVFWVTAYPLFAFALLWQFRLLFHFSIREKLPLILFYIGLFVVLLFLSGWLLAKGSGAEFGMEALLLAFYPLGDLVIVVGVLWVMYTFKSGKFGRPWYGMILFVIADLVYALIAIRDLYPNSIDPPSILSTITDLVYFAAYLVFALGFFSQWLLLIYGPELKD